MNIVFLSPHFPPNAYLFSVRLRELGATVLGLADAPYDGLRPELREALTEYYQVGDMHDLDALIRALGWFTHRHGRIDRLESLNEYWLETDARLRTAFDIPGLRLDGIERIKRKSAMKEVFQRAGVPVARGVVARTPAATREFVGEVGFPIIAKPDIGVGAARTYRIETNGQLEAYLADRQDRPDVDYLLEEFVHGQLLSYDGLVDRDGVPVFTVSLVYGIDVLDAVKGADMHYWIDREVAPDLDELGRRVLKAFDVRERPFHFEFFMLADGSLIALEVNMRQPGGLTIDMWNWANDMDIYRAWAEVVVRGTTEVRPSRANYCYWAGRKHGRAYRLSHDQVIQAYGSRLVHHAAIEDVFAAAIGNYGYILRGPELAPLKQASREILALADAPVPATAAQGPDN
jgi:hypothetical protein